MEWFKLKTIIILILLALNLCLLVLVYLREENTSQYAEDIRDDAVSVLQNNGISLTARLPEDTQALSVYTVTRSTQDELAFATALLGEGTTAENLGGGLYRYTGSRGSAQISAGGSFACQFSALPSSFNGVTELCNFLTSLGYQTEVSADVPVNGSVTVSQLWNKAPLISSECVFTYSDSVLQSASGLLLTSAPVSADSTEETSLSAATLLIRFLSGMIESGYVCNTVTDITPSFQLSSIQSDRITLTPVWLITTDTGNYNLNTITGELSQEKSVS
ncbi:MAG: hypothetical protein H6Q60_895 [Oscillospiraceae bacterium]|nr:hypothetical protein [Oscillospiraceae bacterium]